MSQLWNSADGRFLISSSKNLLDIELIHRYLSEESYWAKGIPLEVVKRSIDHSLCFGVYTDQQQIGFARVITDQATFAYLADVFIIEKFRGQGLSKWLMEIIHAHPDLQGFRRWLLGTRDAHELYAKFGWTHFNEEISKRFMQLHNAEVYSKK